MHFITGGAFNGKRKWVMKQYPQAKWISAYREDSIVDPDKLDSSVVVLEGLEIWIQKHPSSREYWRELLAKWLDWEQEIEDRQLIIIGTDITKGIVPIEKENRLWRDMTGWVYQDTAAICERVDLIWYGINQKLKG